MSDSAKEETVYGESDEICDSGKSPNGQEKRRSDRANHDRFEAALNTMEHCSPISALTSL